MPEKNPGSPKKLGPLEVENTGKKRFWCEDNEFGPEHVKFKTL